MTDKSNVLKNIIIGIIITVIGGLLVLIIWQNFVNILNYINSVFTYISSNIISFINIKLPLWIILLLIIGYQIIKRNLFIKKEIPQNMRVQTKIKQPYLEYQTWMWDSNTLHPVCHDDKSELTQKIEWESPGYGKEVLKCLICGRTYPIPDYHNDIMNDLRIVIRHKRNIGEIL